MDGLRVAEVRQVNRLIALGQISKRIVEIRLPHPVCVAIDGRDGAGKTFLADELVPILGSMGREVIRASIDGFHNPRALRYVRGRSSPEGYFRDSFNYETFENMLLLPLRPGGSRKYRTSVFDYRTDSAVDSQPKQATDDSIVIVDGIFLLRPELIRYWDFTVFVDVTLEVSIARCALRDPLSSADPTAESNQRYVKGQALYFTECNPRRLADIIFNNDDFPNPSIHANQKSQRSVDE